MKLRALEPEDLPALRALAAQPEIAPELDVAAKDLDAWCEPVAARPAIGAFEGDALVGAAALAVNERARTRGSARVDLCAGPDAAAALAVALRDLARDWWRLDRVELVLPAESKLAAAATAAEMQREIVRRSDLERDGAYVDSVGYAWIRPGVTADEPARAFPRSPRGPLPDDFVIREARPDDAPGFTAILTDPAVTWGTLQTPFTTVASWRKRLTANDPARNASFVATAGGEVVASCGLHGATSPRRQHVWVLGMSVRGDFQGRGVGARLMEHLMREAEVRKIARVELDVFADNTRAIALYEKFGFVHEGRKRLEAWRDGAYADGLVMAKLR